MGLLLCCVCCSFNSYTSKCIDITLILLNAISFVLSLLALVIIKWKNVSIFSLLIMILIFLIITSLLIFSIIILIFRKNGSIKTIKKEQSQKISYAGFSLTIILLIICFIGDIALGIDFNKANYPCGKVSNVIVYTGQTMRNLIDKNSIDCESYYGQYVEVITFGEYAISYFCFSYTEIAMIIAICLWRSSKLRIMEGIDGPIQPQPVIMQQPMVYGAQYPPYGYDGQMQQQYVFVQGNQQYVMQPNMNEGGLSSNQYQRQGQYQQQNATPVEKGDIDDFNVVMKPGINVPVGNNQDYSSNRNMK